MENGKPIINLCEGQTGCMGVVHINFDIYVFNIVCLSACPYARSTIARICFDQISLKFCSSFED